MDNASIIVTIPARKRGRKKRSVPLEPVTVRLLPKVFDAYCLVAGRAGLPLAVVLRQVLTLHAPSSRGSDGPP